MLQARLRKSFAPRPDSAGFTLDLELTATAGVTVLFGPSGAGKTLVLDSVAGFVQPDEGRILLEDDILYDAAAGVHLAPQKRNCGYVFQNYALFPHMTLRENLAFAAERRPRLERHRRVNDMLEKFRLEDAAGRRPHELSGGQRQRIVIAMALLPQPELIIADEPTTALDVTVQAQILRLLHREVKRRQVSVLFTTHDLGTAWEICDRVVVMYAGQDVEAAPTPAFFAAPRHPYTSKLLESLPRTDGVAQDIPGEIPSLITPPPGCRFHPRCDFATAECVASRPPVTGIEHIVRCYHPLEAPQKVPA
jgi:oligopeptide/dipeptide ABC transporter ATP-binding protein